VPNSARGLEDAGSAEVKRREAGRHASRVNSRWSANGNLCRSTVRQTVDFGSVAGASGVFAAHRESKFRRNYEGIGAVGRRVRGKWQAIVVSACRYLDAVAAQVDVPLGLGSRHCCRREHERSYQRRGNCLL